VGSKIFRVYLRVVAVGQGVPGQVHRDGAAGPPMLDLVLEGVEGSGMRVEFVNRFKAGYAATFIIGLLGDA
jgi:hypothetical protein